MLEFSGWAEEILRRADEAARRLNPDARVRLSRAPAAAVELRTAAPAGAITTELVDAARAGDTTVDVGGAVVYVAEGIEGLIDVEEPHDRIVLKPAGSPHNVKR
ncbi:MAG: hypothetical protein ABR552_01135 [Actinomycetota bacterium]|nr:hypothetical protein [Actinomycetota bacterium]